MKKHVIAGSINFLMCLLSTPAFSAHLPEYSQDLRRFQEETWLDGDISALQVRLGNNSKDIASRLIEALNLDTSKMAKVILEDSRMKYESVNGWLLTLDSTGTAGHFQNKIVEEASFQSKIPLRDGLSDEQVVQIAARLVREKLSKVFPLESDEAVVATVVKKGVYSVFDENTNSMNKTIDRYIVSFSRKKSGIYLFGSGSRLQLSIAPNGDLIEMTFDWPKYEKTAHTFKISTRSAMRGRFQKILSNHSKRSLKMPDAQVIICGYYDPGAKKRTSGQKIQAACLMGSKEKISETPRLLVVPAAEQPLEDASWKELSMLK